MKKNRLISIIVSSSLLLTELVASAVPLIPSSTTVFTPVPTSPTPTGNVTTTAPEADGTKFFNESTVDTSVNEINVTTNNDTLIGNDTLPQNNIDTGLHYTNNFGDQSTGKNITNNEGNSIYIERNTDGTIPTFVGSDQAVQTDYNARTTDSNYTTWQENYENYVMEGDKDAKRAKENEANKAGMTMNYKFNNNFNEMSNRFFTGNSVFSGGQNLTTTFRQKTYADDAPQELKDREDAGTLLYKDHFSSTVNEADKENLVNNTNYGALQEAYVGLDAITQELTNRLTGSKIKCQISRELVPSYRCPLPGKDGLQYPGSPNMADIRKVNIEEAKKDCNNDCWTDPGTLSCVGQKVIDSKDINLNIPDTGIILTPWDETTAEINVTLTPLMPVNSLTVNVDLLKPADSEMTDAEWSKFVQESGFKFRYSVLEVDTNIPDLPPVTIIDREQFQIRSTSSELTIPINRSMNGLKIKFWKPYITTNILESYKYEHLFTKLTDEGAVIKIKKAKSEYSSDSYYFCQAMQMVANPSECTGDIAEFVTGDDQFNYICNADSKKIGPEPTWGAFYSQESCEFACVIHKECQPTYRHYSSYGNETVLYKAKIGCVDDPETNSHCSQAVCEALFADDTVRPINEMLVANDDTFIYTIRNKVLQNYPRPKIDLAAELATSVDYAAVFENEEKDSAYMYMINNVTYNRIMYRIGTESPVSLAYHLEPNGFSGNVYSVDLKPRSFDYDTGSDYYVYSVVKVVEAYAPIAGAWYLNDHDITATQTYIQWRDYTYLIKTGVNTGDWKVFRKEEFSEYLTNNLAYVLYESGEVGQYESIDWVKTPQYQIKRFVNYNEIDNTFIDFDRNSEASYFTTNKFESSQDFYRFNITNSSNLDFFETKGSVIRTQRPINYDTSFEKIYNQPATHVYKGNPQDINIYLVYSKTKLTYNELMKEIEGSCSAVANSPCYDNLNAKLLPENSKWGAYNLLNSRLFRSEHIKYDGELNNNIKTLIMGNPNKTTVSVDWDPSLSEKGKKIFKFLFLYDDNAPTNWHYVNEVDYGSNPIQAPTSTEVVTPNVAPTP